MQSKFTISDIIKILKKNGLYQSKSYVNSEVPINGTVHTDSRKIQNGDVFVAIKGFVSDGHQFIRDAADAGAVLIISEAMVTTHLPQIKVVDSRKATAVIINELTGNPTSKLKLIGITGTNGKTTTSFIISNLFKQFGVKYGVIGTLGYYIEDEFFPTKLTTPDILDLNRIFLKMLERGVEIVVMEVSAHAISLRRIDGLKFDLACFTNLSRDHLDFYKSMNEYYQTKKGFIQDVAEQGGRVLINYEDEWSKKLFKSIKGKKFSIGAEQADYTLKEISVTKKMSEFSCAIGGDVCRFKTNLPGKYNIRNAVMAIVSMHLLYPDLKCEQLDLSKMDFVPGRLERITNCSGVTIFNDYAHTPDAIEKVLESINEFADGRIITICGAGGDRDKGKRPEMFRKALKGSDLVIVTNDNPRFEKPNDIINDMVGEARVEDNYLIIRDRKVAIETAIKLAHANDIVLIAGKGHEEYQEIEGIRHPFSDKEVALNYRERVSRTGKLSVYLDLVWVQKILGIEFSDDTEYIFKYVSTDSRSIRRNSLFIALKGERFDGHTYLEEVLAEPTNWAIVSRRINHPRCIYVQDTLRAYGELAKNYLKLFNLKTIGITGSAGKTTTKEILYNILEVKYKTHKTFANENNLIGLPKTIFKLSNKDEAAIFELGSNHPGEIKRLAEICEPQIGIITHIGPSHLEFFHDLDGVYKEKVSLFEHVQDFKLYNNDSGYFKEIRNSISIGFEDRNDLAIKDITSHQNGLKFMLNEDTYFVNTQVPYLTLNAALALKTAELLGLQNTEINIGLKKAIEIENRMEIQEKGNRIIIKDCYNANPISMKAAISFWQNLNPSTPHIAFLGDMLELGNKSEEYHKDLLNYINQKDFVVSIGYYSRVLGCNNHYDNIENLLRDFSFDNLPDKCVILLKASNSVRLYKIMERL